MTNAEKLAKDKEFLAEMIDDYIRDCDDCPAKKDCEEKGDIESCYEFLLFWLESEVEE